MTFDVRARVEHYYATLSAGDIDAVAALFALDAVMRDPVGAPPATDDASRRQRYAGIKMAFDAFAIAPGAVIASGTEAAATWNAKATAKNGREVTFSGISTFGFDGEGRITAMSAYWDPAVIAAALSP